jgi:hypothetical protein
MLECVTDQANQAEFDFQIGPHAASALAVIGFATEETTSHWYN